MTQQLHSWGIYPREMKPGARTKTWTWLWIGALLRMTENGKQTIPFTGQMAKQIVAISHHGTLLNNKKKQTTDTHNSLDEVPKNYNFFKKVNPKRLRTTGFHSASTL